MKKLKIKIITLVLAAVCFALYLKFPDTFSFMVEPEEHAARMAFRKTRKEIESGNETIARAFKTKTSGISVQGSGVVARIVADGNGIGSTQRFTVNLSSGSTVAVAHATSPGHPPIRMLMEEAEVEFSGTYKWNSAGGEITNTTFNTEAPERSGWIKYDDILYQ